MSKAYPLLTGWVGYGVGAELFVREDEPLDESHALVRERPELFAVSDSEPEADAATPVRRTRSTAQTGKKA